jgi:arsenate reductase (glutaredoxin)
MTSCQRHTDVSVVSLHAAWRGGCNRTGTRSASRILSPVPPQQPPHAGPPKARSTAGTAAPGQGANQAQVQMFGYEDSQPTRAALRFFRERRVPIHFVDLRKRAIAPGELRRFVERFGADALLDREGKAYKAANLGYLRMTPDEIVERLLADQRLLRLPLVRFGHNLSAGPADATWKDWLR